MAVPESRARRAAAARAQARRRTAPPSTTSIGASRKGSPPTMSYCSKSWPSRRAVTARMGSGGDGTTGASRGARRARTARQAADGEVLDTGDRVLRGRRRRPQRRHVPGEAPHWPAAAARPTGSVSPPPAPTAIASPCAARSTRAHTIVGSRSSLATRQLCRA
jgi:hypothetical protein